MGSYIPGAIVGQDNQILGSGVDNLSQKLLTRGLVKMSIKFDYLGVNLGAQGLVQS